jgi:hypothetical protein
VNLGLLVCDRDGGGIAGLINVSNIVYGRFLSAALGYSGPGSVTKACPRIICSSITPGGIMSAGPSPRR